MRTKSIVLLGLALGCGLVASIGISQIIEQNKSGPQAAVETEAILVAMKPIAGQEQLKAENIKLEQWPKHLIPKGALTKLEDIEGRRIKYSMTPGEPILQNKLVGADDKRATTDVPPGYRLKAVHADAVSAVGNLIQPGDRVDVLVYLKSNFKGGTQDAGTTTILRDIKVFAVNDQWRPGDDGGGEPIPVKNVTLLLTPEQVEKLTLATELGKVSLVLRSPDDKLNAGVSQGTTRKDLFGPADDSSRQPEMDLLGGANQDPKPKGGLLGMLGIGQKSNATAPVLAAVTPVDVERFSMELIEGPQARTVEFTRAKDSNAKWQVSTAAPTGPPAAAEPTFSLPQADGSNPGALPPAGPLPGDAVSLTPTEQD
ncbi:MAG: Flp pilus assembly protein CpaB [Pirellulales bacterium]